MMNFSPIFNQKMFAFAMVHMLAKRNLSGPIEPALKHIKSNQGTIVHAIHQD